MSTLLPMPEQTHMYREAQESSARIAEQLAANQPVVERLAAGLHDAPPRFVVTSARGSSDHAATFAKYVFETQLGYATSSASPSVSSVYAVPQKLDGALYLAISQSGKSPDLLRQAQAARDAGARVVALVNAPDSPLADIADTLVPLHAGPENSVAATKSYLCSLSAIIHIAATWKGDAALLAALRDVPQALAHTWQMDWTPLVDGLADARNLFVVARGLGLAAAQEAALKLKETCGLHAEAFSAAEVKHGPMTLVEAGFPVLFFTQDDDTAASTRAVAEEFRARGAHVWIASSSGSEAGTLPVASSGHPVCAPLVTIAGFYRAANALALRRGRNPDLPPHLRKVTETV
jgi:glucosamine--fructose-6-phosphate aminotransferase (isomerizing)